jgi:hypothetical protein
MVPEQRAEGGRRWSLEDAWLPVMLLPGAMTAYLAFRSGGFYLGATSLAAAEMAVVLGLRFALGRRPLQGAGWAVAAAALAMGAFAAWTLLSADWSGTIARAYPEYSRALLYGLVLLFFGTVPFDVRRLRWMVYGVAAAIVIVAGAALTARLLPHVIFDPSLVSEDRLAYPLTYWNALGILACVGTVLCVHLACSLRDAWPARVLGAAAVPLLAVTLYYTLSRGAIWAAAAAVVIYALAGRSRGLPAGAIATAPTTLIAVAAAAPATQVSAGYPDLTVSAGHHVALTLAGCVAGAAVLRAALLLLDSQMEQLRLPLPGRGVKLAAVAVAVALLLVVGVGAGVPSSVHSKYSEFTDRSNTAPAAGEARLFSARPEGRFELWEVALDSYEEEPLRGTGAGTFEIHWNRDRPTATKVKNAHSLYLEVLGELGVVGLALLLIALAAILAAFGYRARGPDRPLFAALLAAGLAWAVHAGVDWDWQMPAVTLWLFAFGGAALARSLRRRRRRYQVDAKMAVLRVGGVLAVIVLALLPARLALSDSHFNAAVEEVSRGDCVDARSAARQSIDVVPRRAAPYALIAFCEMREGRYRLAAKEVRRALQRDPENWELTYGLAVARAGADLDPRRAARRTVSLNPRVPLVQELPAALLRPDKNRWPAAAAETTLLPPGYGDP